MNKITTKKPTMSSSSLSAKSQATGRWNPEEHKRFVEALKLYGRNWKKVEEHVGTRDGTQVRSHAQKYFAKLEKESKGKKTADKFADRFESASEMRNASGTSDSTQHTQKDTLLESESIENQLKGNLPMSEGKKTCDLTYLNFNSLVSRSSQITSANSTNQILIPTAQGKGYENPIQVPLFNPQLLPYLQAINYQGNLMYPTIPFLGLLPPSYCVYMNLMKYLADCGRYNQSLKLSDFVDLSTKKEGTEGDVFKVPEPIKKVKQE